MADSIIQRSFTGGELAPSLRARASLEKYQSGLTLCENNIIRPQGGVYSRPGTKYIGNLPSDMAAKGRLIPFSFNTEQTYVLVFEDLVMHVIKNGGFVLDGAGPALYSIVTPYTTAQLSRLNFTQDADVMTIVHPSHDPKALTRTDHDAWTLNTISYASSVPAPAPAPTLATVGAGAGSNNKRYTYVVTAVDANGVESVASDPVSLNTNSLSVTGGIRVTWTIVAGAVYYRVYKDPSDSTGIFGWIGDSLNLTFDDFNIAPVTSDSPPIDNLPFAGANNKPSTVGYYQQRQIYANTTTLPQTVYASQSAIYDSLRSSSPARDDDAIEFTIKGKEVNAIRHIVDIDALVLLTSGAEWKVSEGQDLVLTPYTISARIQSYYGCSYVTPAVVGDSVVFIQDQGNRVRSLKYSFNTDTSKGQDLSIMAEHLFKGYEIIEMSYEKEPYGILWLIRSDGELLGLTYQEQHQIWAWHHHNTGASGEFESVTTIKEGDRDATYFIVKRTIDGATVRYVERMEPRHDDSAENAYCVDSGLSYNSTPATVFSGLGHLEGEAITVNADGNEVAGLTVVSGEVTLPIAASVVHIGLAYIPAFETLDIDSGQVQTYGKDLSISKVSFNVEKSRGGWVGPVSDSGVTGVMTEIKPRLDSDGYDEIVLRTTKDIEVVIDPQWSKGGSIRVEQRAPFPLSVLSITPDLDVS